uniref:hypothetical protein n=1 Tax=Parerythrobacter lutipelagi TaxID=1964208 RepID=UPI0010F81DD4|nr:hypothetical protein [Parerythrobacter lutipelagi]
MSDELKAKSSFIVISAGALTFVFVFYAIGAARTLKFFPEPAAKSPVLFIEMAHDALLIWAATSVAIMGICVVLLAYAVVGLLRLSGWVRAYSLIWVGALGAISAYLLFSTGNGVASSVIAPYCDAASNQRTLCDIATAANESQSQRLAEPAYIFLANLNVDNPGYTVAINRIKLQLNLLMQLAGIAILSLTIILATSRRVYHLVDTKLIREAYLLSAGLLSLVVLSDALFFDFIAKAAQENGAESPLVAHQRGLLLYYAIISTATLALTLGICSVVGKTPILLSAKGDSPVDAALIDRAKNFFLKPGFGTAFATFVPLLVGILTP